MRTNAISTSIQGVPGVRMGYWKYIPPPGSGGWATGMDPTQSVQLYNLADDLGASRNLASSMGDKVLEMQLLLERLITEGRSTPGTRQKMMSKWSDIQCQIAGKMLPKSPENKAWC